MRRPTPVFILSLLALFLLPPCGAAGQTAPGAAYDEMIRAFISAIEYRDRFPPAPPFRTPPSGF